jgi:hypothetical protein
MRDARRATHDGRWAMGNAIHKAPNCAMRRATRDAASCAALCAAMRDAMRDQDARAALMQ